MKRRSVGAATAVLVATATLSGDVRAQAADTARVAEAREHIADGAYDRAASLLRDWLERHPENAGVRWLLARTLYWDGDFAAARRQLRRTLEAEPGYGPARELWSEMRGLWAPRLGVEARTDDDVQPLARRRLALEGAIPFGARVDLLGRAELRRLDAPRPGTETVVEGRAGVRADLPGVRLEALGGMADGSAWGGSEPVGSATITLELPAGIELRARGRRWSYEFTSTAVDTALLVETARLGLERSAPTGWSGAAGARLDRFPDGNEVAHGWAWALAPLWAEGRSAVRVGYGFRASDADATRFVPRPAGGPGGPGPDLFEGVYDPHYTPEDVRVHSALAALRAGLSPAVLLTVDGSVGFAAREEAPGLAAAGGPTGPPPRVDFDERDYTPWRIRGGFAAELSPAATLRIDGGYREDAFFRTWRASAGLEWRFLGGLRTP